jgi:hypothetical protein
MSPLRAVSLTCADGRKGPLTSSFEWSQRHATSRVFSVSRGFCADSPAGRLLSGRCISMSWSANSVSAWMPSDPLPRAELLHVLMLPDFERADRIGEFWSLPTEQHLRRVADRPRGGPGTSGSAGRHAAGRRPEHVGRYMAATVTPGTVAERMTLERRIVAAAAPETGGCEEEDQPGYKRDGNQQGDEPPDEAEGHHGIIVPLSGTSRARAARRAGDPLPSADRNVRHAR